jgi:centromere protein J
MEDFVVTKKNTLAAPRKKHEGPPKTFLKRGARWGNLLSKMTKAGEAPPPPPKRDTESVSPIPLTKRTPFVHDHTNNSTSTTSPTIRQSPNTVKTDLSKSVKVRGTMPCMKAAYVTQVAETEKSETDHFLKLENHVYTQKLPSPNKPTSSRIFKPLPQLDHLVEQPKIELANNLFDDDNYPVVEPEYPEEHEEEDEDAEDEEGWESILSKKQTLTRVYNPHLFSSTNQELEISPKKRNQEDEAESSIVKRYFGQKEKEKEQKKSTKEKIEKKKLEKLQQKEAEDKIKELNNQLRFYSSENEKIKRMWDEVQAEKQSIAGDRAEFKRYQESEMAKFESYKEIEIAKIRRDRQVLERQRKANLQVINRKEQEKEMENLRAEMKEMKADFKMRDSRWRGERESLRALIQKLEERNNELEEDLRKRELERIDREYDNKQAEYNISSSRSRMTSREANLPSVLSEPEKSDGDSDLVPVRVMKNTKRNPVYVNSSQSSHHPSDSSDEDVYEYDSPQERNESRSQLVNYVSSLRKQYQIDHSIHDQNWKVNVDEEAEAYHTEDYLVSRNVLGVGKEEKTFASGKKVITYANGTTKKLYPDGTTLVFFHNGDVKKTFPNGGVLYYYYVAETTHTTYPNKLEVYEFSNRQIEKHYPEGTKEILFPDGGVKYISATGQEEIYFGGWKMEPESAYVL